MILRTLSRLFSSRIPLINPVKGSYMAAYVSAHEKNYYFVDTGVISRYYLLRSQHPKLHDPLVLFIEHPNNCFFYTETVSRALKTSSLSVFPTRKFFHFVESKIAQERKENIIKFFQANLGKVFKEASITEEELSFYKKQVLTFKDSLYTIAEAGYSCYAPGVLPDDSLKESTLILTDQALLNFFQKHQKSSEALESVINYLGLEHLISFRSLDDVLAIWQSELSVDYLPPPKIGLNF